MAKALGKADTFNAGRWLTGASFQLFDLQAKCSRSQLDANDQDILNAIVMESVARYSDLYASAKSAPLIASMSNRSGIKARDICTFRNKLMDKLNAVGVLPVSNNRWISEGMAPSTARALYAKVAKIQSRYNVSCRVHSFNAATHLEIVCMMPDINGSIIGLTLREAKPDHEFFRKDRKSVV